MTLFFENKFEEAEAIFAKRSKTDPMFALGLGALGFLKAIMTFSESDLEIAAKALHHADKLASAQLRIIAPFSLVGAASSALNWIPGLAGKKKIMQNPEFRASIIKAESNLLLSILFLFRESVVSYLKAGLKLRRGHATYSSIWSQISTLSDETVKKRYDRHSMGGLYFGIGMINISLSVLPPKLLKLVSVLGFKYSQDAGLPVVEKCLTENGFRSPVASLALLCYSIMFQSFAPQILTHFKPLADRVLRTSLEYYPKSALHLYMHGRAKRLEKNIEGSSKHFNAICALKGIPVQLRHLCYYELGLNAILSNMDWAVVEKHMRTLFNENYWSRAFYAYLVGVSCLMQSQTQTDNDAKFIEARNWFSKVPGMVTRKFGGRVIAVEAYVIRKSASKVIGKWMGLEVLAIWNLTNVMVPEALSKTVELISEVKARKEVYERTNQQPEIDSVINLVLGEAERELGHIAESTTIFESIISTSNASPIMIPNTSTLLWTVPVAYYNLAVTTFLASDWKACKKFLELGRAKGGYEFEHRFELRMHLSSLRLEEIMKSGEKVLVPPSSTSAAASSSSSKKHHRKNNSS